MFTVEKAHQHMLPFAKEKHPSCRFSHNLKRIRAKRGWCTSALPLHQCSLTLLHSRSTKNENQVKLAITYIHILIHRYIMYPYITDCSQKCADTQQFHSYLDLSTLYRLLTTRSM